MKKKSLKESIKDLEKQQSDFKARWQEVSAELDLLYNKKEITPDVLMSCFRVVSEVKEYERYLGGDGRGEPAKYEDAVGEFITVVVDDAYHIDDSFERFALSYVDFSYPKSKAIYVKYESEMK